MLTPKPTPDVVVDWSKEPWRPWIGLTALVTAATGAGLGIGWLLEQSLPWSVMRVVYVACAGLGGGIVFVAGVYAVVAVLRWLFRRALMRLWSW